MQRGRSVINTTVGSCVYVGVKLSALHCVLTHGSKQRAAAHLYLSDES